VLRKEDNDWVKKCMEYEVMWKVPGQEVDQRKLGQIVEKDCQAHVLNRQDSVDCIRWMKQIRDD